MSETSPTLTGAKGAHEPIDMERERLEMEKLRAEVRQLKGLSPESLAKFVVGVLAVAAAAWAFYLQIPQTKIDLANALRDLSARTEEATKQAEWQEEVEGRRTHRNSGPRREPPRWPS